MNARQRTLAGLANATRRPASIDNQCVNHVATPNSLWPVATPMTHGHYERQM
jgi:hypothetical protein